MKRRSGMSMQGNGDGVVEISDLTDKRNIYLQFIIEECKKYSDSIQNFSDKILGEDNKGKCKNQSTVSCREIGALMGSLDDKLSIEVSKLRTNFQWSQNMIIDTEFDYISFLNTNSSHEFYTTSSLRNFVNKIENYSLTIEQAKNLLGQTKYITLDFDLFNQVLIKVPEDNEDELVSYWNNTEYEIRSRGAHEVERIQISKGKK